MGWQPIETAPKDESDILGYCAYTDGSFYIYEVWFCSERQEWRQSAIDCDLSAHPTHWMPSPEPPAPWRME